MKPISDVMIASSVPDGGIYRCRLYENGELEIRHKTEMPSPKYMALDGEKLWSVLMDPFPDGMSGIVCTDAVTGEHLSEILPTYGKSVCHLAISGEDIYVANYTTGNLLRLPEQLVNHTGSGPNPDRQQSPHVHGVFLSPDEKYLLVCDLGLDAVFTYTRDLQLVSRAQTPPGAGPRHLCFSRCGKYVYTVNEMGASVSVFAYSEGVLTLLDTVSILPGGAEGEGAGSAIKLSADGKCLYATERVSATIAVLQADGAKLTLLDSIDCRGREPRDFELLGGGRFLLCTNQFSDSLVMYRLDENGFPRYLYTREMPAPLCAIEVPMRG